jgi:hypothetical protein
MLRRFDGEFVQITFPNIPYSGAIGVRRLHPSRFFFGLCRTVRRPVDFDGVAFVSTFFDAVDATGVAKREAHLCSKRL